MKSFLPWLRTRQPQSRRVALRPAPRNQRCRPALELLEDRTVPAVVTWINPAGGNWHNAAHWSDGAVNRLPGIGDDVVIPDLVGNQTITHDSGSTQIASLTSAEKVHVSATSLHVSGNLSVASELVLSDQAALFGATILADTSVFVPNAAHLYGVTLNGSLNAYESRLDIRDGLTVNGVLGLNTGVREAASILRLFGTQTIGGTGRISFSGPGSGILQINAAASTVTFGPNLTVTGGGGGLTSNFANSSYIFQGTLTAAPGYFTWQAITIDTPNFRNEGLMQAVSGGAFGLQNTWSNSGTLRALGTGTIRVDGTGTLLANTLLSTESGSNVSLAGSLNLSGCTLDLSGAGRITLDGGILDGGTLDETNGAILRATDNGGTLSSLTLNGNLDVVGSSPNGAEPRITISNGLTLNGIASVGSGNSTRGTIRLSNTQTIGGTGAINFGGGNGNQRMLITTGNVTVTFAPGFTIRGGGGSITSNFATSTYVFQGRVAADRPDGGQFGTLGIGGANWRNEGVMEAGPGSTLQLSSNWRNDGTIRALGGSIQLFGTWTQAGSLSANGGTIDADGAATWLSAQPLTAGSGSAVIFRGDIGLAMPLSLDGPVPFTLSGRLSGTIHIGGGGYLDAQGGTLDAVTLDGNLSVFTTTNHTGQLTLTNGLVLGGQLSVSHGGMVRLVGAQSISGGAIRFGGESGNTFDIITDNSLVTIGSFVTGLRGTFATTRVGSCYAIGGTIVPEPGGTIGISCLDGSWSITNTGTMLIVSSSFSTPGSLSTAGNISVGAGGSFSVSGVLTQTGGASTLTAGNAVLNASNVVLDGGALAGIGTVNAPVTNAGQVSPGLSPGILTINGAYTQTTAGSLAVELNGTSVGSGYDRLRVNGTVTLYGALNLARGFASTIGNTFLILENDGTDSINGSFEGLSEGGTLLAGGVRFEITYRGGTGNDVVLTQINTAPMLAPISDQTVVDGELLTFAASATDVDASLQSIEYRLDPGAPQGAAIDAVTGVFTWTPTPAQSPGTYAITVLAIDNASPPLSAARTFNVAVLESNQAPTDIGLSNASVPENQPSGSPVGAFSSTDPDADDTFSYTLVIGAGDDDNGSFTIDAAGNLKTADSFDFETKSAYSIRVRSTDAGGLAVDKLFTIAVTNVNEAPTVNLPAAQIAFEDVDHLIGGVRVGDPDGGSLTVALAVGHGMLTLGTTTGLTVTGNGNAVLSLSGTMADLNAALASLVYRGGLNCSGSDTLHITASDGSFSATGNMALTVKSAAQQAADLQAQVAALKPAGVLNAGQANSLKVKLNLKGNAGDIGKVQSFLDHVLDFLGAGILTQEQADTLLGPGNILLLSVTRR